MPTLISNVSVAKELLLQENIVGIPTETVYGLAADASSSVAIAKIYALKQRPQDKTLSLNIHATWPIEQWCESIPQYAHTLIKTFWPGPLTLILPLKPNRVLPILVGPGQSIALRCPAHPLTIALLETLGRPLVAPSANPSNALSPTSAQHVATFYPQSDLHILDGGCCTLGIESTILKIIDETHCEILRFGAVSAEQIETCIGFKPNASSASQNTISRLSNLYYFEDEQKLELFKQQHAKHRLELILLPEDLESCQKSFYQILQNTQNEPQVNYMIKIPFPTSHDWQVIHQQIKKFASPIENFQSGFNRF